MPTKKVSSKQSIDKKNVNQQPEVMIVSANRPQVLRGLVLESKLAKTVTVLVNRSVMHPLYKKSVKRSKRYLVHDELSVKPGDLVDIVQIRPMSANKFFKVQKVVGQDIATIVSEEIKEGVAEAIAEVMPEEVEEVETQIEKTDETVKVEKPNSAKKENK